MSNALEKTTVSRQQRRQQERLLKWVNTLAKDKQSIINRVVEERAKQRFDNNYGNYIVSVMAALELKFGDSINMNDIQEIIIMANILDKDKFYMKYEGEDWMKKLDKDTELLKKEIEKNFKNSITSQNSIVKEIRKDERFKNIAIKDIVVIFKEIKDRCKGIELKEMNEAEKEIEQKLAYIFKDKKTKEQKKVVTIDNVQELKMNNEGDKKKTRKSEELKKEFIVLAEEKEKIEKEKKILEEKLKNLSEEHSKVHIKEDKLGQAIELLESIGM